MNLINQPCKQVYSYNSIIADEQKEMGLKIVDVYILCQALWQVLSMCCFNEMVPGVDLNFREAEQFSQYNLAENLNSRFLYVGFLC